jgi:sortase (surface protein transpeptidase)
MPGPSHVYEIRSVDLVAPDDLEVFRHEEQSWLTLITCQGYDEAQNTYRQRVAARAVLVAIEDEGSLETGAPAVRSLTSQPYQPPTWHDDR